MELVYVFIGGGLGSLCRFGVARVAGRWDTQLPLGTIAANILACFILGMIIGWSMKHADQKELQLLLAVGFCGGFSTFSTFALENVQLWQNGAYIPVLANIILSVVICFVSVFTGLKLVGS